LYMGAVNACSEWLKTTTERLESARRSDVESDTDILLDRLGHLSVRLLLH